MESVYISAGGDQPGIHTVTATCPSNEIVLNGGFNIRYPFPNSNDLATVVSSDPSGTSAWEFQYVVSTVGASRQIGVLTVKATCASLS